jgi:type VI secretion system secreted protein Hcp
MSQSRFVSFAAIILFANALPASADNIYCVVMGAQQGTFHTDPVGPKSTQIPVLFLTQGISTPYSSASGQATGKQSHSPLTITKALDASSVQFFVAAVTNERLQSVKCSFYRQSNEGLRPYFQITLTNAVIVEYKNSGDGVNGDTHSDEHERISFTYQKIALTDLDSGMSATDDWNAIE